MGSVLTVGVQVNGNGGSKEGSPFNEKDQALPPLQICQTHSRFQS